MNGKNRALVSTPSHRRPRGRYNRDNASNETKTATKAANSHTDPCDTKLQISEWRHKGSAHGGFLMTSCDVRLRQSLARSAVRHRSRRDCLDVRIVWLRSSTPRSRCSM